MIEYAVIIQARMGSTRRPGKINYHLIDEPMLAYQIKRLQTGGIKNIIVATTDLPIDDVTQAIAESVRIPCFRGSEDDVMGRYLACCREYDVKNTIRVGGDDPLLDPDGIKFLISTHSKRGDDVVYASHPHGWIYGTAAELFSVEALSIACNETQDVVDREHVVRFLKQSNLFTKTAVQPEEVVLRRPDIFLSVDYQEDLDLIEQIVNWFDRKQNRYGFSQYELIDLYDSGNLTIKNKHLHSGF